MHVSSSSKTFNFHGRWTNFVIAKIPTYCMYIKIKIKIEMFSGVKFFVVVVAFKALFNIPK